MKTKDFIFIFVLFYLGWFGSVFLARTEYPAVSLVFPLLLTGYFIVRKSFSFRDLVFVIGVSIGGSVIDYLFIRFGLVSITRETQFGFPVWLVSLWLLFALSIIKFGLKMNPHFLVAAVLGGVMGPLSYKSGEYFQVLSFSHPQTFLFYALFWAISFPIILKLSKRLV